MRQLAGRCCDLKSRPLSRELILANIRRILDNNLSFSISYGCEDDGACFQRSAILCE